MVAEFPMLITIMMVSQTAQILALKDPNKSSPGKTCGCGVAETDQMEMESQIV